ncbi:hypothetical protein JVT61DRAFT_3955 [Boletus reticuloceps]|uniref:Uncharacterized protein n=1 Tax=Boletus reticuloceps TaxID=495285 RepID=A0A8I3A7I8_9AGAM|nr:hypothetical protein JVT61DRAFT_3955 [Boletus reticuloceps]
MPESMRKAWPLSCGIQRSGSFPNVSDHSARVKHVRTAKEQRLASTKELDKYMPALRGKCPYHFILEGKLVDDNFPHCPREPNRNRNREGPICHMDHTFPKAGWCAFSQFIFRTTFCLWQVPTLRVELIKGLHIQLSLNTQEEFTQWVVDELADEGKSHNCLEAFLWLCRRKEKENPRFFV